MGSRAVGHGTGPLLPPYGNSQAGQADANILEGVEQEDAHNDREEAAERPDDVIRTHMLPLFEEDGRAGEHRGGEEHVVDGRHQRGVEYVQSLVQVVDLCAHTAHQTQEEDPSQRISQHVLPCDCFLDGDTQSFDAGHRQCPDYRADGDVDQDVGLAVAWTDDKYEDQSHDDNQSGEDNKS